MCNGNLLTRFLFCLLLILSHSLIAGSESEGQLFQILNGIENQSTGQSSLGADSIAKDPLLNNTTSQNKGLWNQPEHTSARLTEKSDSLVVESDNVTTPLLERENSDKLNLYSILNQEMLLRMDFETYRSIVGGYSELKQGYQRLDQWLYNEVDRFLGLTTYDGQNNVFLMPNAQLNKVSTSNKYPSQFDYRDEYITAVNKGISLNNLSTNNQSQYETSTQKDETADLSFEASSSLADYLKLQNLLKTVAVIVCLKMLFGYLIRLFRYLQRSAAINRKSSRRRS